MSAKNARLAQAREIAFRDWYIGLLDRVGLNDLDYADSVKLLSSPEPVTGYREVRYPKMDRTMAEVETALGKPNRVEVTVNRDVLERMPAGV